MSKYKFSTMKKTRYFPFLNEIKYFEANNDV